MRRPLYDEGKGKERKDISVEKFSKSRCEEKKRVGSAVQGNFCWVGRVRPTTDFFFLALTILPLLIDRFGAP